MIVEGSVIGTSNLQVLSRALSESTVVRLWFALNGEINDASCMGWPLNIVSESKTSDNGDAYLLRTGQARNTTRILKTTKITPSSYDHIQDLTERQTKADSLPHRLLITVQRVHGLSGAMAGDTPPPETTDSFPSNMRGGRGVTKQTS